jgi:hypothetical protein
MLSELPPKITRIIQDHHRGGISQADCRACSSACCSHSGFAILENLQLIYQRYQAGLLQRPDFAFEPDLSFKDFTFKHFDVIVKVTGKWFWKKEIVLFYPKCVTAEGQLIAIPGGDYYCYVRAGLFNENPWLNWGCAFLSHKVPNWPQDDGDTGRYCLLHTPDSPNHLSAKPIDCVFFTCTTPLDIRVPSPKTSARFFRALASAYPHSVERFRRLIEKDKET